MTDRSTKLRLKESIKKIRGAIFRLGRPVSMLGLDRVDPVSRDFGSARGTPIDRRYIERFLATHAADIRGRAMEIADPKYILRFGGDRVTHVEVLHATEGNANATVVGDLSRPETLPENRLDCFICTQTLNFIYDFHGAIRGLHRILKPGGVALVTLAGISQVSRYDMDRWGDYWRFTDKSARMAFEAVFGANVVISSHGNALAATAFLQGLAMQDLPDASLLDRADPDYPMIITVRAAKSAV